MISYLIAVLAAIVLLVISICTTLIPGDSGIRGSYDSIDLKQAELLYKKLPAVKKLQSKPPITFDDLQPMEYREKQPYPRIGLHLGQRKLALGEIQFLTIATNPNEPILCVYAGAAPSEKIGFISRLFPQVKFLLIDPNRFDILTDPDRVVYLHKFGQVFRSSTPHLAEYLAQLDADTTHSIFILNDLMTNDLAEILKARNCVFISDIRTNSIGRGEHTHGRPDTVDIIWNLAQQYVWCKIMKPKLAMFKFRYPFYSQTVDISKSAYYQNIHMTFKEASKFDDKINFDAMLKGARIRYFAGKLYLQAFAGASSTETRLITDCKTVCEYPAAPDYDSRMNFYNVVIRSVVYYKNKNAGIDGIDNCADCALEYHIWHEYFAKHSPGDAKSRSSMILKFITELSKISSNLSLLKTDRAHGNRMKFSRAGYTELVRCTANAKLQLGAQYDEYKKKTGNIK